MCKALYWRVKKVINIGWLGYMPLTVALSSTAFLLVNIKCYMPRNKIREAGDAFTKSKNLVEGDTRGRLQYNHVLKS